MNEMQPTVVGVGCFAAEPTLARVLRKMVATYSLGDFREALAAGEDGSGGCRVLRRLVAEMPGTEEDGETIAGFFLAFEGRCLKLSVFTRRVGRAGRKYTASLEHLARLRRQRLH